MFQYCPNCESKNVIIYEGGDDESTCLDCAFAWKQFENYIAVPIDVLKQLVGLKKDREASEEAS
jgi:hypothetical protein